MTITDKQLALINKDAPMFANAKTIRELCAEVARLRKFEKAAKEWRDYEDKNCRDPDVLANEDELQICQVFYELLKQILAGRGPGGDEK